MTTHLVTLATCSIEELPAALTILDEAAQWLNEKGIHQWQSPLPEDFIDFMRNETLAGRVYLARTGDLKRPIATFRITHSDLPRWHDAGEDNALYIYSLAIRNDSRGLGIGTRVIDRIMQMAGNMRKTWLRLDVWSLNETLQTYYKSLGFLQAGTVSDNGFPLTLYQVHIASGNRPSTHT